MPKLGRKSEHQQFDFMHNTLNSTVYAPFGTENTPLFRQQIIGGKLVPIVERPIPYGGGVSPRYHPRIETLHPITEKPNHLDPGLLKEYTRKLHSVNQEYSSGYNKPTTYSSFRPDSKDVGRRYSYLPPIDHNKWKNEYSTVFEPEAWTRRYMQPPAQYVQQSAPYAQPPASYTQPPAPSLPPVNYPMSMSQQVQQANQQPDMDFRLSPQPEPAVHYSSTSMGPSGLGSGSIINGHQSPPLYDPPHVHRQEQAPKSLEDVKYDLVSMLPKHVFLPDNPLHLTREEEGMVLRMVAVEMRGYDPQQLKDAYLDITKNYDHALTGWCHYKNVFFCLSNAKITLSSDLLRIVSAMFVSPSKLQEVNYEKFLSFLGTSLTDFSSMRTDQFRPGSVEHSVQPGQYYTKRAVEPRPGSPRASRPASPFYDKEVGKLLSMTEQQLHEDGIDFEGLVARFQLADREMRETLSADQIKEIVFSKGVKLQESVVNKILSKCEDLNRDGQYNWVKFVEFLEKVQPAKTGLTIPRSKMPLEYAKQVPSPVPSWPRADNLNTVREPVTPLWRKKDQLPPGEELYSPRMGRRSPDQELYEQEQEQLKVNRESIEKIDKELKQVENNYEVVKNSLRSPRADSPWFKMFMEFAQAIYKQDSANRGSLPRDEMLNWTKLYNSSYNLGIPSEAIASALSEATTGQRVNISTYLRRLGARGWVPEQ